MNITRLARPEINLLKHLARFSSGGVPITVPSQYQAAFVPLWRLALIEIWYRQDRDAGRHNQFISITVDGSRRIDAILSGHQKGRKHD